MNICEHEPGYIWDERRSSPDGNPVRLRATLLLELGPCSEFCDCDHVMIGRAYLTDAGSIGTWHVTFSERFPMEIDRR